MRWGHLTLSRSSPWKRPFGANHCVSSVVVVLFLRFFLFLSVCSVCFLFINGVAVFILVLSLFLLL